MNDARKLRVFDGDPQHRRDMLRACVRRSERIGERAELTSARLDGVVCGLTCAIESLPESCRGKLFRRAWEALDDFAADEDTTILRLADLIGVAKRSLDLLDDNDAPRSA